MNLGDSNNVFESVYAEKINTGTRIVDMNNLSLNAGGGASSVGVEIPCNLQEVVFNVITTEYGYPTNIYFADNVVRDASFSCDGAKFHLETHVCCLYVKFRQGSYRQSNASYECANLSGKITLPTSEIQSGYLKLTTSGGVFAMGSHEVGTEYSGYCFYSYDVWRTD